MKKIIFTILLAVSASLTASAQTFEEFFNEVVMGNISGFNFLNPNNKLFGTANNDATKGYVQGQMQSDIVELIRPYYESAMTEGDMKELCEAFKQPKIKLAREHILASMTNDFGAELAQEFAGKAMSLVMGGKADDIELKQGISKKYAELCKEFCETSGANTIFDALFKSMPIGNNSEMLNNIFGYVKTNMPTILANKFYGNVTNSDLKALQKISKTQAYKHFNEGTTKLMSNIFPLAKELEERMEAWDQKNK